MNRALRAAALGMVLFSTAALSACSAGQVNQTSSQVRDKVGPQGLAGTILLREVQLAYPASGSYSPGDDAELQAAIVNDGDSPDTLLRISGPDFAQVRITGSPTGTASASPTNNTGTGNGTATTPASPTGSAGTAAGSRTITVPAHTTVVLGQSGPTVTLVGLSRSLTPAQAVPVTFTFQTAGTVTVDALVATPTSPAPRTSTFNFEPETPASVPGNEAGSGGIATGSGHGNG